MFDTRQIGMFVNNVRVPGQPYKIDGDCYISAYSSLFDVVNKRYSSASIVKKKNGFLVELGRTLVGPVKEFVCI